MNYEDEEIYSEKKQKPTWMKNFQNLWTKENDSDDYYDEDESSDEENKPFTIWTDTITTETAKMIIENLGNDETQIINFENTDPESEHDIRYILYGAIYALDGKLETISDKCIMIAPGTSVIEKPDAKPKRNSFIGNFKINGQ